MSLGFNTYTPSGCIFLFDGSAEVCTSGGNDLKPSLLKTEVGVSCLRHCLNGSIYCYLGKRDLETGKSLEWVVFDILILAQLLISALSLTPTFKLNSYEGTAHSLVLRLHLEWPLSLCLPISWSHLPLGQWQFLLRITQTS